MSNQNYKSQYLNPKWQKKRLEILNRDKFTCQLCGSKDKTLHVHHKKYIRGRKVWDYKDDNFITLCNDCHRRAHVSVTWLDYIDGNKQVKHRKEIAQEEDADDIPGSLFVRLLFDTSLFSNTRHKGIASKYSDIEFTEIFRILDSLTDDLGIALKYIDLCLDLRNKETDIKYLEDENYIKQFLQNEGD